MFPHTRRRLEAQLADLQKELAAVRLEVAKLDPAELTRLRQTVNNAIRSLDRRAASEKPEEPGPNGGSPLPSWAKGLRL